MGVIWVCRSLSLDPTGRKAKLQSSLSGLCFLRCTRVVVDVLLFMDAHAMLKLPELCPNRVLSSTLSEGAARELNQVHPMCP